MRLNTDIPSAVVPSAVVIDLPQAENSFPVGVEHQLDPDLLRRNRIVGFSQANELAHPYVVLRSQLLKHAKISGMRIFAITSVQPGNGKTHVAVNLSAALSRLHPTILVDLDLRRPSVGKSLGLCERQPGIDDFLSGDVPLLQSAVQIDGFDLSVHHVREHRNNAEDLLASSHLSDLIAMVRTAGNNPICIIDTPPALVHDDLMLIARIIDGVLMVVEEGRTPRRALKDTISALSPTPVVGSVLNMSISSPHEASYYSYESAAAKPSLFNRHRNHP
ncbi:CpsD/CapB family tyrosine-protein kinase [Sphingobium aromaticiconvertens]|uniref:tyrosine-protein kinase family protein n=1 Tax=Sphingobium aromaticiconvertens TaxID=365341 RepID=UPI00301AD32D